MDLGLAGRVVWVTGGGSGIGLATVRALLAEGAVVATCGRDEIRLRTSLTAVSGVWFSVCDVLDEYQVTQFVEQINDRCGRLDALINNAGQGRRGRALELSTQEWGAELMAKVASVLNPVRAALGLLRQSDAPRVVNLSSITSREPDEQLSAASAARAAVGNLTRSLSRDLADDGILVNAVGLGMVDTARQRAAHARTASDIDYADWLDEEVRRRGVLLGRPATPEEIALPVVFLASPANTYATGATLEIDGGIRRGW